MSRMRHNLRSVRSFLMAGLTSFVLGTTHFHGATAGSQAPVAGQPTYGYTVVRTYPHDADAFTQGLQYLDGVLYEGTGLNGRSSIRKVKFETGEVLQQRATRPEHFGEGI